MRAQSLWYGVVLLAFGAEAENARCEQPASPEHSQVSSCPTVLPVTDGERSVVVPSIAPHVEAPPVEAPHIASLSRSPQRETELALLREKLAQRDQLQREIAILRESTQTPEQISVRVKMMEVNQTRLRQVGPKLSIVLDNGKVERFDAVELLDASAGNAVSEPRVWNVRFDLNPEVLQLIDSLESPRHDQVGRVLAAPAVVTTSGRPASIEIGGEVPVPQPGEAAGFKSQTYGTRLDLTAVAIGNNRVRLDIRPRVSALDESRAIVINGQRVPALSVRQFETSLEMELGKTTIMSGMVQERVVSTAGWFGRTSESVEEVALVLAITPEVIR